MADAAWRKGWLSASIGDPSSRNPYKPRHERVLPDGRRRIIENAANMDWQRGWDAYHAEKAPHAPGY